MNVCVLWLLITGYKEYRYYMKPYESNLLYTLKL